MVGRGKRCSIFDAYRKTGAECKCEEGNHVSRGNWCASGGHAGRCCGLGGRKAYDCRDR